MTIRMPSRSDLSSRQRSVVDRLDRTGISLIVGPPGTGKTVIGMWRALELSQREAVHFVCYNRALMAHSKSWCKAESRFKKVKISTVHAFANQLAFDSLDRPKFGGRNKTPPWPVLPDAESQFDVDWKKFIVELKNDGRKVDLGHLIMDEGQDFPADFHFFLGALIHFGFLKSITVMADENQRIGKKNASIIQIREQLISASAINEGALFEAELTENFRNTVQIATVASKFYVGLESGIPQLPRRKGPEPLVNHIPSNDKLAALIANHAVNNRSKSFLVICPDHAVGGPLRNKIFEEMKDRGVSNPVVTRFVSGDKEWGNGENLRVGEQGVIAVVHPASMKGLEADVCILAGIELFRQGNDDHDVEFMNLYVATSRARSELHMYYAGLAPKSLKDFASEVFGQIHHVVQKANQLHEFFQFVDGASDWFTSPEIRDGEEGHGNARPN